MSPNKTLYIREEDMPVWERAEGTARRSGVSLSQLVTQALRGAEPPLLEDDELQEIEVEVGENHRIEAFAGRWLVEPDSERTRTDEESYDKGTYWGVALTKHGSIAVYTAHCNYRWPGTLEVYGTLDAAELPEDIKADAAAAMGRKYVVYRDI